MDRLLFSCVLALLGFLTPLYLGSTVQIVQLTIWSVTIVSRKGWFGSSAKVIVLSLLSCCSLSRSHPITAFELVSVVLHRHVLWVLRSVMSIDFPFSKPITNTFSNATELPNHPPLLTKFVFMLMLLVKTKLKRSFVSFLLFAFF